MPAGKYKVAISKRVDGKTTALASAETFQVVNEGGAAPIDFLEKVTRLQSAVSGALEAANTAKQRLAAIKRALEDSAADPKLMEERNALDHRLDALLVVLSGDQALRVRRENVSPRLFRKGPTESRMRLVDCWSRPPGPSRINTRSQPRNSSRNYRSCGHWSRRDLKKLEQKLDAWLMSR